MAEGQLLIVHYCDDNDSEPIPITVDQQLVMGPGGTLQMLFDEAIRPDCTTIVRTVAVCDLTGVTPIYVPG